MANNEVVTPQSILPAAGYSFPPDLTSVAESYMTFRFEKYRRRSISEPPVTETNGAAIRLPMPSNLREATSVSYGNENLGMIVGAALESIVSQGNAPRTIEEAGQRIVDGLSAGGASIGAAIGIAGATGVAGGVAGAIAGYRGVQAANAPPLTATQTAAAAARGAVLGRVTQEASRGAGAALSQYMGIGINPYMTVMFKHPDYKEHQFEWKLVPRNPEESRIIAAIIRKFKSSMLPSLNTTIPGNQTTNLLFDYPDVVKITISPANEFMYKFKTCVVKNFVVNYAPGNSPSFYKQTNAPAAVTISMQLGEIEYWKQEDYASPMTNPRGLTQEERNSLPLGAQI
jgi:hypothetical protein